MAKQRKQRKSPVHVSEIFIRNERRDPPDPHKLAKVLVEIATSLQDPPDQAANADDDPAHAASRPSAHDNESVG
jgi:hypothetical protein